VKVHKLGEGPRGPGGGDQTIVPLGAAVRRPGAAFLLRVGSRGKAAAVGLR
jgi:hypothetical protein